MPTIIIPDKICPHCGGNRWYVNEIAGKSYYQCPIEKLEKARTPERKKKKAEYRKKYVKTQGYKDSIEKYKRSEKGKQAARNSAKRFRKTTHGKAYLKEYFKKWKKGKGKNYHKKYNRKLVENMDSKYCARNIVQHLDIKPQQVPSNLINIYKKVLCLKRKIRPKKSAQKQQLLETNLMPNLKKAS